MLGEQLVRDELDGLEVGLDRIEIEQRDAELLRSGDGDLARVRQIVRDQVRDQIGVRFPWRPSLPSAWTSRPASRPG
jgi:hypothetical protein